MKRYITKSIDGVSPLPQAQIRSRHIHSVSSRQKMDAADHQGATNAHQSGAGVFGVSSFGRSLHPVSLNVEQERFVRVRPLI